MPNVDAASRPAGTGFFCTPDTGVALAFACIHAGCKSLLLFDDAGAVVIGVAAAVLVSVICGDAVAAVLAVGDANFDWNFGTAPVPGNVPCDVVATVGMAMGSAGNGC